MDETLVCWTLLLLVLFWRALGRCHWFQRVLHCLGPLAGVLQWYTLLFVGLGSLLARTLYDIVVYEWVEYRFLDVQTLQSITNITDAHMDDLRIDIHPTIRLVSLLAPVFGLVGFAIIARQVYENVAFGHNMRLGCQMPWQPTARQDMVLLVIAMPAVFVVMALRSELRMWAVMTGSAWLPYSRQPIPTLSWDAVETLQMSTYTTNLELACAFQYYTVFSFALLCASYLTRAPQDYRYVLTWAGLQGVYLYVLIGVARSVLDFTVAVFHESPKYSSLADALQEKALGLIGAVFTVATLLCVYNIFIISKVRDLVNALGNVSKKFLATRMLLLFSQIQLQVLTAVCVGSSFYANLTRLSPVVSIGLERWHLSIYRARLWHAALLIFECFFIAWWNRANWQPEPRLYGQLQSGERGLDEGGVDGDYRLLP